MPLQTSTPDEKLTAQPCDASQTGVSSATPTVAAALEWQITPERQRHEWLRTRRMIIAARLRIVIYGHLLFFLLLAVLRVIGVGAQINTVGWLSLCFASIGLLLIEFIHMKLLPKEPPRFVVRRNGVTEYDADGPRAHWDWARTRCLALEQDRERPEYQSLVFVMDGPQWLWRLNRFYIPLPETEQSSIDPRRVVVALDDALRANNIQWKAQQDGTMTLITSRR